MAVVTASELWLPEDRPMTVADLDLTPDDGRRYELDDGVLVVTPPPGIGHQIVLHRLEFILESARPPEFELLAGPGVKMSEIQYRFPDLVVVRAGSFAFSDKNFTRPPALAVEVASPSTAAYDRNRKKTVYAEFGIPDYWIVIPDPDNPLITAYTLHGTSYAEAGRASGAEAFTPSLPFPVKIVPADLVAGNWRR
jgi:Uma2 family endonuclease